MRGPGEGDVTADAVQNDGSHRRGHEAHAADGGLGSSDADVDAERHVAVERVTTLADAAAADAARALLDGARSSAPRPEPQHDPNGGATARAAGRPPGLLEGLAGIVLVALGLHTVWLPFLDGRVPIQVTIASRYVVLALGVLLMRWAPRRGWCVPTLLVVSLLVWVGTAPYWTAWLPEGVAQARPRRVVLTNALIAAACLLVAGGRRAGAHRVRTMWVAVVATTVPVGVWEAMTGHHLVPDGTWRFPASAPAAVFGNPNNFAVVLTVGFGIALVSATDRLPGWRRGLWLGMAAVCAALVHATSSRAAEAVCAVLVLVAATLWWARTSGGARRVLRRRPRTIAAAAGAALVTVVASVTVPALVAVNPVLRIVRPTDGATARSDSIRLGLVQAGLDMWRESPWFGIGVNHFDVLVKRHHPEFLPLTSMHNGLVEMLVAFGIVVAAPFAVTLLVIGVEAVRPLPRRDLFGRPSRLDVRSGRALTVVYLLAFLQAGVVVSSSVPWSVWWLLLASSAATAWWTASAAAAGRAPADADRQD